MLSHDSTLIWEVAFTNVKHNMLGHSQESLKKELTMETLDKVTGWESPVLLKKDSSVDVILTTFQNVHKWFFRNIELKIKIVLVSFHEAKATPANSKINNFGNDISNILTVYIIELFQILKLESHVLENFLQIKFSPALLKKTIICLFRVQKWKQMNFKIVNFVFLKNRLI